MIFKLIMVYTLVMSPTVHLQQNEATGYFNTMAQCEAFASYRAEVFLERNKREMAKIENPYFKCVEVKNPK